MRQNKDQLVPISNFPIHHQQTNREGDHGLLPLIIFSKKLRNKSNKGGERPPQ